MNATQTFQGPDRVAVAGDDRHVTKDEHAHPGIQLITYTPEKREEWDCFVLSNPQAGFSHLSSELMLAEEISSTANRSIMAYEQPGRLVAIMPLYTKTAVLMPLIRERALLSPGGPLFHVKLGASERKVILDILDEHVKQLARQLKVDRIKVTYPSFVEGRLAIDRFGISPLRPYGFIEINEMGTYLDLRRTEAELLASHEKSSRHKIRKAEKDGIVISAIDSREDWLACERLNQQTLGQEKSRKAMEIIWDEFIAKGHAFAYIAKHGDRPVSVEVIQIFNTYAYLWIAFNARPIFPGANNYLIWYCILRAKQLGMSTFLVGSYYCNEEPKTQSISDFKKRFGGTPYYVLGGSFILKRKKRLIVLLMSEFYPHLARPVKACRHLVMKVMKRTEG